jgi:tetratricopeptide (TPR) repeat protein
MGLIYFEKGQLDRAATEFSLVLAAAPDDVRVRYYLASVQAELGQSQLALKGFAAIPPDSDYYVDAQVRRAYLLQKDDPTGAIRGLESALRQRPESLELMAYLASLYRQEKDYPRAIQLLEQLVAQVPDNDRYRFTLGAAYDEANQKERSLAEMRKAIQLNPRNAAALNYLGYSLADQGVQLDEAERLIRRALELQPNEGIYIDSLGWVYYRRGDYKRAVEQLERAVELAGEDPTIVEHLGDAYQRLGRGDAALRVYRDALLRAKDEPQIERLKGKIQLLGGSASLSDASV